MRVKTGFILGLIGLLVIPAQGAEKVRKFLTTGSWYPSEKSELTELMNRLFSRTDFLEIPGNIVGLIAPHAGFGYSGICAARAYRLLDKRLNHIKRIILLGSSHHAGYDGACVSDFTHHSTPLGKTALDRAVIEKLAGQPGFRTDNRIMQNEHSLENQLPFLQWVFRDRHVKIIPILFGRLDRSDYTRMAGIIRPYIDRHTLVVASSDLNHYGRHFGYTPFTTDIEKKLNRLDQGMIDRIIGLDIAGYFDYRKKTGITMCGFVPVGVLLHLFTGDRYSARLVDYSKSGDRTGDYSLSVSYASVVIHDRNAGGSGPVKGQGTLSPGMLSISEQRTLLALARETLANHFKPGKKEGIDSRRYAVTHPLRRKAGVFVTLKKNQQLRGCIGSLIGQKPLYEGVMDNVINAAIKDPRFPPLRREELDSVHIEISVMTPLQKIDAYRKIRLGVDGVVIKKDYYQAVFLPQVATETGWTLDEFLGRLCRKAGLDREAYRSPGMEFYIFQAQVFGESQRAEK